MVLNVAPESSGEHLKEQPSQVQLLMLWFQRAGSAFDPSQVPLTSGLAGNQSGGLHLGPEGPQPSRAAPLALHLARRLPSQVEKLQEGRDVGRGGSLRLWGLSPEVEVWYSGYVHRRLLGQGLGGQSLQLCRGDSGVASSCC